jgi:protein-tyrosine phosphatase
MTDFSISKVLALPKGQIGISPIPGASGDFEADVSMILLWRPDMVISLTTDPEMGGLSEQDMAFRLYRNNIEWVHLPVGDYGVPDAAGTAAWADLSPKVHAILERRGRVLVHCKGGRGRSGMLAMRVLVEAGFTPQAAFSEVRAVRPGAVETEAQQDWASSDS